MNVPEHLDDQGRRKWAEVLPVLQAHGDADQGTLDALAAYCSAWSRWTGAEAKVTEQGAVVDGTANPYIAIAGAAQRQLRQWSGELKLTPKTRGRAERGESAVMELLRNPAA